VDESENQHKLPVNKLLLLGTAQSGKSTLFKQMRIINNRPFSDKERRNYAQVIRENLVEGFTVSLKSMRALGISFTAPTECEEIAGTLMAISKDTTSMENLQSVLTPELGKNLYKIWLDSGFKQTLSKRSEFSLNDTAEL